VVAGATVRAAGSVGSVGLRRSGWVAGGH